MKPPQAQIRVGRVRVPIEAQMRYLGLTLDGTWCFKEHFNRLVPRLRLSRVESADSCREPGDQMEGASPPRWGTQFGSPVRGTDMGGSPGRQSPDTSNPAQGAKGAGGQGGPLLPYGSGAPTYGGGGKPLARTIRRMKHQTRLVLLQRWQGLLANARYGRRTVEAVRPFLPEWVGRAHGTLTFGTFRMAQVLTGHGCF
ncbi:uncharacterized protein LOC112588336, partial [Harpegnathos saltator]|uniref:uncharacterized protein LOC112588336 n=1 Tax=Harpegnathos saltator TaxID=610380 RepID=UPI000DBEEBEE